MMRFFWLAPALSTLALAACSANRTESDARTGRDASGEARPADAHGGEVVLPARPGPFAVGLLDSAFEVAAWGEYVVTIYYPATVAGAEAPADRSEAPYPLIAFAHGWQGNRGANAWVGRHLAGWGYVVLLIGVPGATNREVERWGDGLIGAVEHALGPAVCGVGGPLEGLADPARVGLAGHSMGAAGARLAGAADPRIGALVLLTPCAGREEVDGKISAAVQLQAAELDGMCPPADGRAHYDLLGPPKQLLVIAGGNHIGFLDGGLYYDAARVLVERGVLDDQPATISREAQEQLARGYLIAWFEVFLKQDPQLRPFLFGEPAARDLSAGRLLTLVSDDR